MKDLGEEELEGLFTSESEDPEDAETIVRWFWATYYSSCFSCADDVVAGELAGYIDGEDEASCQDCCNQALS